MFYITVGLGSFLGKNHYVVSLSLTMNQPLLPFALAVSFEIVN